MLRAANLVLAAATVLASAPAQSQTPPVRAWQQQQPSKKPKTNPAAKKPPPKPVKKATGKQPRPKAAPGGVVIRSGDSAAANAAVKLGPAFNPNANAQRDISEALLEAKRDNRRVLIHWGANWSEACQRLHRVMATDKAIQRLLLYEYELVLVDVGKRERNLDIALSYGVAPQASGVPWLTLLDADSQQVANLHAERFADGKGGFDAAKIAEFMRGYQAMYPAADTLLSNAMDEARASERPLLLQFSSPACERCTQIEEWFGRSDVAAILDRSFARLRLDVDRTVGGRDILRRYSKAWQTTIPWFALIDPADGEIIATSDGLDGRSMATLADDAAIARFGELLRDHAKLLTPQELDWLTQTLRETSGVAGAAVATATGATSRPAAASSSPPQTTSAETDKNRR